MKTVFFVAIMVLISTAVCADIANYGFRVAVERDVNGKYANWTDIPADAITFETDDAGALKVYTDVPDANCLSTQDMQAWYVDNESSNGWYKILFKVTDAGMILPKGSHVLQYGFVYTRDKATSPYTVPVSIVIKIEGGKPIAGQP